MSWPSLDALPRPPLGSLILAGVTVSNAFLHRSMAVLYPVTRSAFDLAFGAGVPRSTLAGAAAAPPIIQQLLFASSVMCATSCAQVRTSGVGCHVYFSAGNCSADANALLVTCTYCRCTSETRV